MASAQDMHPSRWHNALRLLQEGRFPVHGWEPPNGPDELRCLHRGCGFVVGYDQAAGFVTHLRGHSRG